MDSAAIVMVLQALREVNVELRAIRRTLDRLAPASEQPANRSRLFTTEAPDAGTHTAAFPRPVERTGKRRRPAPYPRSVTQLPLSATKR